MKKILMLVMLFFLTFAIFACDRTTTAIDETDPVFYGYGNIVYVIGVSATPVYTTGVTAIDNLDGNISSKIVINSSAVNLAVPGTYTVTYAVTDLSGNTGNASITVTVVDATAPVISGYEAISFVIGGTDPDWLAGATATDNVDGDITDDIVVNHAGVNLTVAGLYPFTYTVEDAAGNESAVYTNYIQVKLHADDADLTPPVFSGQSNVVYTIGISSAPNYLLGVTAIDNIDGDVTDDIVVNSAAVNLAVAGTYDVTLTVTDSSDNESTITIRVTVQKETEAPIITGAQDIDYYVGDQVPDYLKTITAVDNLDGDLTEEVIVDDSAVNLGVPGVYDIIYSVTDAAGNVRNVTIQITVYATIAKEPDLNAIYYDYTSGTDNLNPYSETLATASTLYGYLTDSLYSGDYDWAAAEAQIIDEGFTVDGEMDFADWYAAGHTAGQLPFNRFPAMAAGEPVQMDTEGKVWRITMRTDLEFEDGTAIDANTFDYSWQQLLDPLLLNDRASNLYDTAYLPLLNAEGYFKQNNDLTDGLGFLMYKLADLKISAREYSYNDAASANTGYDLYSAETGLYQNYYAEYWGASYSASGWVLVDFNDNPFYVDAEGVVYAPDEGYLDNTGAAIPAAGETVVGYAEALPAFFTDNGDDTYTRTAVGENGLPTGGATFRVAVPWSEVGFKVIDQYTIELTLSQGKTAWDLKGALESGIVGVVHPVNFEAGLNEAETQTTYGTIDNPLVSYGPYNLTTWEDGSVFVYELNPDHYDAADYRITTIHYDVIEDQSIAVEEFKAGRLDNVGAGGQYYTQFKYSKNLKLSPVTTFFRFFINIAGSEQYDINPLLTYIDFRTALYLAIDRQTFCADVRAPSLPTHGFLGPVYLSTEYNGIPYRSSAAALALMANYSPETAGYDPVRAKQLFDTAYAQAVTDGKIVQGDTVSLEYKFYDVDSNWRIAEWIEDTVEAIFNGGESFVKFDLTLAGVSSAALNDAWDNFDFEVSFGGWQGLNFDAPSMLGQVYNSALPYMNEHGFNTADAEVTVSLPNSKVAVTAWLAQLEAIITGGGTLTDAQQAKYDAWTDLLAMFEGDVLTCTYNELYEFAYNELYNVAEVNYAGKGDDFDRITAAMEGVLLEQMIAIPLFTSVSAVVYSDRIVFEANEYHAWMAWGGLKYMYIAK